MFGLVVYRASYMTLNEDNLLAHHVYPVTLRYFYAPDAFGPDAYIVTHEIGIARKISLKVINPRRACAARVTVVVLCVCLSATIPRPGLARSVHRRRIKLLRGYVSKSSAALNPLTIT